MSQERLLSWMERLEVLARYDPEAAVDQGDKCFSQGMALGADRRPDEALEQRFVLVRAIAASMYAPIDETVTAIRSVNAWATLNEDRYVQARCERALSVSLRRAGDAESGLAHAVTALDLLETGAHLLIQADHLLGLADALLASGSFADAERRYKEAYALATEGADVRLRILVLNNLVMTHCAAGNPERAVADAEQMSAVATSHGIPLPLYALDSVARTYLIVGRHADAERLLLPVANNPRLGLLRDDVPATLLTLVEAQRLQGKLVEAGENLEICARYCEQHGAVLPAVDVLRERAELHAASEEFVEAFEVFREYHERSSALHSQEREARARMMQAIFETAEARRDSERFREMSYRDPLTRLHNRRYVDEHLAGLIESCGEAGLPLTVAFVDLDRFKRINDTCSHEVGDEVLRRVAVMLSECAAGQREAMAARMGGEEFLLVFPGLGAVDTLVVLEELRARIEGAGWSSLTGDLPVTASFGSATAPVDARDRLNLLACADARLYEAKHTGRNRIVQYGSQP